MPYMWGDYVSHSRQRPPGQSQGDVLCLVCLFGIKKSQMPRYTISHRPQKKTSSVHHQKILICAEKCAQRPPGKPGGLLFLFNLYKIYHALIFPHSPPYFPKNLELLLFFKPHFKFHSQKRIQYIQSTPLSPLFQAVLGMKKPAGRHCSEPVNK